MDVEEQKRLILALDEVIRLASLPPQLEYELNIAYANNDITITQGFTVATELFELLTANGTSEQLLKPDSKGINKNLFQLLAIHFSLKTEKVVYYTIADIKNFVQQDNKLKKCFANRSDISLFIIYLECFKRSTWIHYATCSDGDHTELNILNFSLPFCKANLDGLLQLISNVKDKYPERSSYRLMASSIMINLQTDEAFRHDILRRVEIFFDKPEWKEMLPAFLKGAVNNDNELFKEQLHILSSGYPHLPITDRLYASGVACPEDESSLLLFSETIQRLRDEKTITSAEYLHLFLIKNQLKLDTIAYIQSLATVSRDKNEIAYLSDILLANIEQWRETWFQKTAQHIIPAPFPELVVNFNNLLSTLVEKDPRLTYDLLTLRFIVNGAANFLDEPWHELPDADSAVFETSLVNWFNSGIHKIHSALHHLASSAPINSDRFRFDQITLAKLSANEKYFIACKVTGYIYEKHILRSLLFSLTASIQESETIVLDEIFNIFTGYVIHNYRSTLDEIKKIITLNTLPPYLIAFYQRIVNHFEDYFNGLDQVPALVELRPDKILVEHISFYRSQQMSNEMKKMQKTGTAALFKNVTINSNRWAIRRKGQKIHEPQTLALVRTEIEFPAGEILNPVSSERFRVIYQRLEKNEINIS